MDKNKQFFSSIYELFNGKNCYDNNIFIKSFSPNHVFSGMTEIFMKGNKKQILKIILFCDYEPFVTYDRTLVPLDWILLKNRLKYVKDNLHNEDKLKFDKFASCLCNIYQNVYGKV